MKKFIAMLLAIAMMATLFAACGGDPAETTGAASGNAAAIKIGLSGPLTGGAAVYGTAVEAGMEIAVAEINAKAEAEGGLKIEFQAQDDEHDAEKAVSAYNTLKDWGMQFFAGAVTTNPCLAIAPMTVEDQMFMMTPSGSAAEIAMTGENIFQMCFTDPNQGMNAATLVHQKEMGSNIAIIYDSSDAYSVGLRDGFAAKAAELNMNIVCETSFTDTTKSDLTTQVTQCKDAGADLVFLPIYYQEASLILTYANTIGYAPTFFGCDGMDGILDVDGFDPALAEGLALMTPFNADDPANASFVEQYKEKMNGQIPNQFAADGYDVIYAIYEACVATGVDGNTSVADACEEVSTYIASLTFDGLTGTGMTWNSDGMISKVPAAVVIENGTYVAMG